MFQLIRSVVLTFVAAAGLAACADQPVIGATTPRLDENFGMAVRQAVARQTTNPEASQNRDPVTGIDGESAKNAIDRYQESFRSPVKTFETSVGGLGGSTGQ